MSQLKARQENSLFPEEAGLLVLTGLQPLAGGPPTLGSAVRPAPCPDSSARLPEDAL